MTQHTLGPWKYIQTTNGHEIYMGTRAQNLDGVRIGWQPQHCIEFNHGLFADDYDEQSAAYKQAIEAEANARLAASAPDLLEAAKSLLDCISYNKISASKLDKIESARAVIAKAEGR